MAVRSTTPIVSLTGEANDPAGEANALLPQHARLVAAVGRPRVWYLLAADEGAQVNGRPVLGGVKRLGAGRFSARLKVGDVELECRNDHRVMRETAPAARGRCARCAQPIQAGQELVRCECGAGAAHAACSQGRCHRCGAREDPCHDD